MTHGSLFSGIGGFDLGAEMAGIDTIWNCEIEEFQRKILAKRFPNSKQYVDIRDMSNVEHVDVITGGFPCQDISVANFKAKGIDGERSGLFREQIRIIGEVRPKYGIFENSPAILVRGFGKLLNEISELGYMCEWCCIPNSYLGFPHKRNRLYAVIYTNENRRAKGVFFNRFFEKKRFEKRLLRKFDGIFSKSFWSEEYPKLCRMDNGIPEEVHRFESVGNAVNPYMAKALFETIKRIEKENERDNV